MAVVYETKLVAFNVEWRDDQRKRRVAKIVVVASEADHVRRLLEGMIQDGDAYTQKDIEELVERQSDVDPYPASEYGMNDTVFDNRF